MKLIKMLIVLIHAKVLSLRLAVFGAVGIAQLNNYSDMVYYKTKLVGKSLTGGFSSPCIELSGWECYNIQVQNIRDATRILLDNDVPGSIWTRHAAVIDADAVNNNVSFAVLNKLQKKLSDITRTVVSWTPGGTPDRWKDTSAHYGSRTCDAKAGEGIYKVGL